MVRHIHILLKLSLKTMVPLNKMQVLPLFFILFVKKQLIHPSKTITTCLLDFREFDKQVLRNRPIKDFKILLYPWFIYAFRQNTLTHLEAPTESNLRGSLAQFLRDHIQNWVLKNITFDPCSARGTQWWVSLKSEDQMQNMNAQVTNKVLLCCIIWYPDTCASPV